ncbi:Endonuclease/exonuclease/phosphatase, partial [Cinara cedri]
SGSKVSLPTIKIFKTSTSYNSNNNGSGLTVQTKHSSSPDTFPHPKGNKTNNYFFTPNRYEVLKDNVESSEPIEMTTESVPQTLPLPPIFITSTIDYRDFCNQIKSISGDEGFLCKSTSKNLKLSLYSSNSFRQTIKLLNDNSIEYHTYQAKEDKPYRVVLKYLYHSIPTDYISQELTELDLNPETNNSDIFKLEILCYSKIKIEEPHTRRDLPQYHRCQNYGHTRSYCNRKPRCLRCELDHLSDMCDKSKDLPATCALCGEGHPSNYKGCTVHKQLQKSRTVQIADQRLTKPSITDATNSISNQPKNFVQDSSSSFQNLTDKNIDIALISETHFIPNSCINVHGYKGYFACHPDGSSHAGLALYIKSNLSHYPLPPYIFPHIQASGGDYNAKNPNWGNRSPNTRGRALLNCITYNNL